MVRCYRPVDTGDINRVGDRDVVDSYRVAYQSSKACITFADKVRQLASF